MRTWRRTNGRTGPRLAGAHVLRGLLAVCVAAVTGCAPAPSPTPTVPPTPTSVRYITWEDDLTVTLTADGRAHVTLGHTYWSSSWESSGQQFLDGYADASVLTDLAAIITRANLAQWDGRDFCDRKAPSLHFSIAATYPDHTLRITGNSEMCTSASLLTERERFDNAFQSIDDYLRQLARNLPGYSSLVVGAAPS